jgi:hypothetical protein
MHLGDALQAQGKFADAEKEYRAVLAIRARVLGPEHRETLDCRNKLANVLQAQGKKPDAVK